MSTAILLDGGVEEPLMSAVPKRKLTAAEYLAIERAAPFKSEFYDGEMFAMSGASYEHTAVKDNLVFELGSRLKGGPCRTLSSDMRVKVSATGLYTYPDVIILCGPPELEDAHGDVLLNPQVIVEILSDSTEKYDRGTKFRHYQSIASLREYVLVAQDQPLAERFVRQPDGSWNLTSFAGLAAELPFASVPVRMPLADIYAGVTFPESPGR